MALTARAATLPSRHAVQSPASRRTYTYDAAHRLQTVTDSRGPKTLTYSYSPGGLRNAMTDSDGNRTTYLYDGLGRLTGLRAPTGDLTAFAYDPGGRLRGKTFANGVTTRYTYNPDNTLARLVNRAGPSDSSMISQHDYTYDGVGNRITHLERIGATTTPYAYTYDPLDRLTQVSNSATGAVLESETYDPLGNRLTKTSGSTTTYYRYDLANQLTQTCADTACVTVTGTFTYDLNGNLVTRTDGAPTTMAYDAENRLAWIGRTGQLEQSYAYDPLGRRLRKTVGGTTTQYLYDGPNIIAEYATWASPTARTTHGPGTDDPLLRSVTATSTTQFFHQDGLGSVIGVSNQTGGTDATQRFDAWGNTAGSTGTIPVYGYTGREPDETGLIYYRARYYDPTLGRFTQRDPLGLQGGPNLYAYVSDNPISRRDPSGLLGSDPLQASQATASVSPTDPARGLTVDCQCLANVYAAAAGNPLTATDAVGQATPVAPAVTAEVMGRVLGGLSIGQVTNIIFNEIRSLSGPGIDEAQRNAAFAIFNAGIRQEETGITRPRTESDVARVPQAEQAVYNNIAQVVARAYADRVQGIDHTYLTIYFNFRPNDSRAPRWDVAAVSTQVGPFNNSYPTNTLPRTGIYAVTYWSAAVTNSFRRGSAGP